LIPNHGKKRKSVGHTLYQKRGKREEGSIAGRKAPGRPISWKGNNETAQFQGFASEGT